MVKRPTASLLCFSLFLAAAPPQATHKGNDPASMIREGEPLPTHYPNTEEGALFNQIWSKLITKCGPRYFYSGSTLDGTNSKYEIDKRDSEYYKAVFPRLEYERISEAQELNGLKMVVTATMTSPTVRTKMPYEKWGDYVSLSQPNDVIERAITDAHLPPAPISIVLRKEKGQWYVAKEPILMRMLYPNGPFRPLSFINLVQPKLTCEDADLPRDTNRETNMTRNNGSNPNVSPLVVDDSDQPSGTLDPQKITTRYFFGKIFHHNRPVPDQAAMTAVLRVPWDDSLTSHQVWLLKDDLATTFANAKVPLDKGEGAIHFIRNACTQDIVHPPTSYNKCTQIEGMLSVAAEVRGSVLGQGSYLEMPPTEPGTYYMLSIGQVYRSAVPAISYYVINLKGSDGMQPPPALRPNNIIHPKGTPTPTYSASKMLVAVNEFAPMKVR